mmetsp:Transcript_1210/g.1905  ORF Transcript_1210/g.1905 Transcript_1210/m.1905 type:complete len:355 (+) Transcript_1210:108-1172(+)
MVERTTFTGAGAPQKLPEGVILGMGNPLLDVMAHVPQTLLDKYEIKSGSAILAEEKHQPIYDELVNEYDVMYEAGGATQNSIRVAQWLSQSPGATSYIGSVGQDKYAEILSKSCEEAGVTPYYHKSEAPTGVCAVAIVDKERSLCTRLDAANEYKHSHTMTQEIQAVIEKAKIFYSAGFFLTVPEGPESLLFVAKHASTNNKTFCLNLSAEFLVDFFAEPMMKVMPYTDFVFANELEASLFGKKHELGDDLAEVAAKLSAMPKENGSRPRVVVFSQGADPTIVAVGGKVTIYPVPVLKDKLLIDTNGAGDAFVGGFLARLAAGFDIAECVRCAHYAARVVIQRSGCSLPGQPDI